MRGELVRFQMFDLGGSLDLTSLRKMVERRNPEGAPLVGKGTPVYVEFPRPLVLRLPDIAMRGPFGEGKASGFVSFFAIGAVSVRIHAPFTAHALTDLQSWTSLRLQVGGEWLAPEAAARALFEAERGAWEAAVREPYTKEVLDESYTIFALSDVGGPADEFFQGHLRDVAELLKGERGGRLHEKEVREGTRTWFSYYADDVIVVDWDAAFLIDPSPEYEDLVFVLEIANVQLLEFRAYDNYLDDVLAKAYDELALVYRRPIFSRARRTAHELSLLRMEIAEFADEADNITKFLGDWFLARVYAAAQVKFHLSAWRDTVDEKLATLHQLYQIALSESDNRRLLVLEVTIVLLFVLDLLLLFFRV
jgi:hypothetical protein